MDEPTLERLLPRARELDLRPQLARVEAPHRRRAARPGPGRCDDRRPRNHAPALRRPTSARQRPRNQHRTSRTRAATCAHRRNFATIVTAVKPGTASSRTCGSSSSDPTDTIDPAALAAVADQLRDTLATGEPEPTKALLRLLIKELRVNGRSEILPTYRVVTPEVCATQSSVERTGIEPVTSGLQN